MEEGCYCCELFLNLNILLPFREVGVRRRVGEAWRNKDAFRERCAIFLKAIYDVLSPRGREEDCASGGAFCRNKGLTRAKRPGFRPWPRHLLTPWLQAFYWSSLGFLFFTGRAREWAQGLSACHYLPYILASWFCLYYAKGRFYFMWEKKRNSSWS